jgi:hypothetical protein
VRAAPWAAFAVAYLAAWFVSSALPTPLLWHLPLEHRFVFAVHPLELGADYYGRVLLCLAAGALGFFAARAARPRRPEWLTTLLAWSMGLLAFCAALCIYTLAHRQPIPAPLPPGYVAR